MKEIFTAVIQAGGKGTRLRELTKDKIPKPMVKINGKPMLAWQIQNLRKCGILNIIIIIGYMGDLIKEYFGDGSAVGVHIEYIEEKEPLGSAGALYYLKGQSIGKNFFLIFGDVIFDLDLERMESFHLENEAKATLLVHPNAHPQDSDLIMMNQKCQIMNFISKNKIRTGWYHNCVNAGIYVLSIELIRPMSKLEKMDLETDLLFPEIVNRCIYGYHSTEYVKDAGTMERFSEVEFACISGIWKEKNLTKKQKCIFLDRDGTINVHKGLIFSEEQFELEQHVSEAVQIINNSGYLAIVITNQSVVARGLCEMQDVEMIHNKMETLLGEQGAYLDDVVFCPHHPDSGYPEENKYYKVICDCRKPATGMIDRMIKKYNIDCSRSYLIGDTTVDIQTGRNKGMNTILLHTGEAGKDCKFSVKANREADDLLQAVKQIMENDADEKLCR